MTYFRDLAPCSYGGDVLDSFERFVVDEATGTASPEGPTRELPLPLAVGWLSRGHEFTVGPVEPEFRLRLAGLFEEGFEFGSFRGVHECEFCDPLTVPPPAPSVRPSISRVRSVSK